KDDGAARSLLQAQAMITARQLIARIADESNLILDPDLDSYYTMSVFVLRLPELATKAVDLGDAAAAVRAGPADNEARVKFLLAEGAFAATIAATMSDAAAADAANAGLQRRLEISLSHAQKAVTDYSDALRAIVIAPQATDAIPFPHRLLQRLVTATDESWRQASLQLAGLLQQRIDRFYRRMAMDLGVAALVWLLAFGLILMIARQITRPIRDLAAVAERVRYGKNYNFRARDGAGGEIGSLIGGFYCIRDRPDNDAVRAQQRTGRVT